MANWIGDFDTGSRVDLEFCTVDSTGLPTALTSGSCCVRKVTAGTPAAGSLAPMGVAAITTSGGLNHLTVFTGSDSVFFATGADYHAFIGYGTVSGVSVVGYALGHFSIRNRAALYPTTAGRTLDVSSGGEAGLDWANIGSPTTTVGLSGTTVKTATDVETDTADIQSRLPAALTAGGNIKADTVAWNALATVALPLIPTVAGRTLDVSAGGEAGLDWANVGSPTTTVGLTNTTIGTVTTLTTTGGIAQAVWDQTTAGHVTAGTFGGMLDAVPATSEIATATDIASAVWDMDATGHQTQGTFGQAIGDPAADTNTIYKAVVTDATGATVGVDSTTIIGYTDDIGVAGAGLTAINLPDQTMNITGDITGNLSGTVGSVTGAVGSVTGNVGGNVTGSIGSLAAQAKTDVNTEVLDVLNVDTFAQPGQGTPGATTTIRLMLAYLYKAWRNRTTQTASQYSLYNDDAATVDHKATFSDDGTTADKGEIATGP